MSAPRRRHSDTPSSHHKSSRDRMIVIVGIVAILALTAFLIWVMRPGDFRPLTGGIITRQPRVTWVVVGALAGFGISYAVTHGPNSKFKRRGRALGLLAGGVVVLVVGTIVLWAARWDGIVRHYTPPTLPPTASTVQLFPTTTTANGSTTTAAPGTSTSGASGSTTTGTAPTTTTATATATTIPTPTTGG